MHMIVLCQLPSAYVEACAEKRHELFLTYMPVAQSWPVAHAAAAFEPQIVRLVIKA